MTDVVISAAAPLHAAFCTDPGRARTNNEDLPLVDVDRERVLAGATPGPLERDGVAVHEHLATPDAPGLAALLRAGQARGPQRAGEAQPLGPLQLAG